MVFASLLVLQAAFLAWSDSITKSPLEVPITLSPAGSVDCPVRVAIPERYELDLLFKRAGHDFTALKQLVGDSYRANQVSGSGVHVPIRWSLAQAPAGDIVAFGELDSWGASAFSARDIYRNLGEVSVPAGTYVFHAQILRDVPELEHVESRLQMHLNMNWSSTWQMTTVFWGGMALVLLAWPATAILVLLLAWRAGLAWRAAQRVATQS